MHGIAEEAGRAVEAVRAEGLASRSSLERTIERLTAMLAAGRASDPVEASSACRPAEDARGRPKGATGSAEDLDPSTPAPAAARVEETTTVGEGSAPDGAEAIGNSHARASSRPGG